MPEIEHNAPKFQYRIYWKKDKPGEEWQVRDEANWRLKELVIPNQPTYERYKIRVVAQVWWIIQTYCGISVSSYFLPSLFWHPCFFFLHVSLFKNSMIRLKEKSITRHECRRHCSLSIHICESSCLLKGLIIGQRRLFLYFLWFEVCCREKSTKRMELHYWPHTFCG